MQLTGGRAPQIASVAWITFLVVTVPEDAWKQSLVSGPTLRFWAYTFVVWALLPLSLLAVLHRAGIRGTAYGLAAPLGWKDIAYVTPLPLVTLFVVGLFTYAVSFRLVGEAPPASKYPNAWADLGALWPVGVLFLSLAAGFWESIFYIGLPWLSVQRWFGSAALVKWAFALVSASIFAYAHYFGIAQKVGAFAFQLVAVMWFFKLRTLWPVILAHVAIDLTLM